MCDGFVDKHITNAGEYTPVCGVSPGTKTPGGPCVVRVKPQYCGWMAGTGATMDNVHGKPDIDETCGPDKNRKVCGQPRMHVVNRSDDRARPSRLQRRRPRQIRSRS